MADAAVSNTAEGNLVWVRIPSSAPPNRPSAPALARRAGRRDDALRLDRGGGSYHGRVEHSVAADDRSLQERFAPGGRCFGCGPANPIGLRIASRPSDGDATILVARFVPLADHEAFAGVVNGDRRRAKVLHDQGVPPDGDS
ncbi:MAG: hypothetical protein QOF49_1844, partial [Chloroflexota bacterium]|nr:hypothetical protein [Chloroflexota bacterium]